MSYSNKLKLDEFFFALENEVYAVAKLAPDFPNYISYSDIDIICCDMGAVSKSILKVANRYIEKGFTVRAECDVVSGKAKIDLYSPDDNERLDFRFDIITKLPEYKKVRIKPHYLYSILEGRTGISRACDDQSYFLYIPSAVDDLVIRYLEYIEWYELRPDKVKHLEYILETLSSEPELSKFIDKLHLYTELLPLEIPAGSHFQSITLAGSFESNSTQVPLYEPKQIHLSAPLSPDNIEEVASAADQGERNAELPPVSPPTTGFLSVIKNIFR